METKHYTLEKLTDHQLIEEVLTKDCNESLNILMSRHLPICNCVSKKYLSLLQQRGISVQDFSEDRYFIFYKAISSYDINKKCKFSTWLAKYVRFHCLNTINGTVPLILIEDKELAQFPDTKEIKNGSDNFDFIMSILDKMHDKRIKKIFISRFLSGTKKKSWKEVAKDVGLSNQQCINLYIRAKRFIRAKLDNPELIGEI